MKYEEPRRGQGASETVNAQRIYALLYRLEQNVGRLETLVRSLKKQSEERENT